MSVPTGKNIGVSVPPDLELSSPKNILQYLSTLVQEKVRIAIEKNPEFFSLGDHALHKELRSREMTPDPTANRIRIKFWMEHDRALEAGEKTMKIQNAYHGVLYEETFFNYFLAKPECVAWMLCPPASYAIKVEEGLDAGLRVLRDILDEPHRGPDGKLNIKLMELKAKITQMFDVRQHGAALIRTEQVNKNMNLNINTSNADVAKKMVETNMEDIQRKIEQFEREERKLLKQQKEKQDAITVEVEVPSQ